MADEQKTEQEQQPVENNVETTVEEKEPMVSQAEVDKIVERRLAREKSKYEKMYSGIDPEQARKLLEEKENKQMEDQKARGEFEKILKEQAEKSNKEIAGLRSEIEKVKVDGALVTAASKNQAINPEQVKDLLKGKVKLTDDGKVEILAENNQPMYNKDGDLKSIDEYVKDFITENPHFQTATPSGSGSKANLGKVDAKPFNLADLDMTKPEDRKQYAEYKKVRDREPTVINLTKS
jgi:acylphosphatase|tara:strand:- start:1210 stop:1917 length:708 start_codon:yes stop_codon:yes gene_type:complete